MAPVTFHKYGSLISPISVFKPVNTKQGNKRITATSSTFDKYHSNLEISGIGTHHKGIQKGMNTNYSVA
jgi:hypothetical protein